MCAGKKKTRLVSGVRFGGYTVPRPKPARPIPGEECPESSLGLLGSKGKLFCVNYVA
jgi:hypothetical protein